MDRMVSPKDIFIFITLRTLFIHAIENQKHSVSIIPNKIMHITSQTKEMEATVQRANDTIIIMYEQLFKESSRHDKVFISMSDEYVYVKQYTVHDRIGLDRMPVCTVYITQ